MGRKRQERGAWRSAGCRVGGGKQHPEGRVIIVYIHRFIKMLKGGPRVCGSCPRPYSQFLAQLKLQPLTSRLMLERWRWDLEEGGWVEDEGSLPFLCYLPLDRKRS